MSDDDSRTVRTRRSGPSGRQGRQGSPPSPRVPRTLSTGAARPALPDPQHDRHVSFPDDQPDEAPGRPHPAAATLPAEAWAPRTTPSRPRGTSVARPGPPPPPTPVPRPRRRLPGWVAVLLVPPLLLGIANNGDGPVETCDVSVTGELPGVGECDPTFGDSGSGNDGLGGDGAPVGAPGVWVEDSTDTVAPLLRGRPKAAPVPASATALKVEIVTALRSGSASEVYAQVDTSADGFAADSRETTGASAFEVHLDPRPRDLSITAALPPGNGTVQCRVYAGETLVAVSTSDTEATCTPAL
ncbi:hypothetical protein [Terrabacter sp. NPDC000476]|uniref:hypothetical protein n=1 Tax=Terrabacter sp. NPDC000476 TaxID=3154258 RepID=UPI0033254F79